METQDALDRDRVSFSQAERLAPLPAPLKRGELSKKLRNDLFSFIYRSIQDCSYYDVDERDVCPMGEWRGILSEFHTEVMVRPIDEFGPSTSRCIDSIKGICLRDPYNVAFDFIQHVLRHRDCPEDFADEVERILTQNHAAYRLSPNKRTLFPYASEIEAEALTLAFESVSAGNFKGARTHLERACEELNCGKYADSVRESIHSVESTLKTVSGNSAADLSAALRAFEKQSPIHPALRQGLEKLYGYSSDEKGIRHSLLEEPAKVNEAETVFMLSACAAFVTYIIQKQRTYNEASKRD